VKFAYLELWVECLWPVHGLRKSYKGLDPRPA
jgi:hypothetical protein